jgi:hypothetical protein
MHLIYRQTDHTSRHWRCVQSRRSSWARAPTPLRCLHSADLQGFKLGAAGGGGGVQVETKGAKIQNSKSTGRVDDDLIMLLWWWLVSRSNHHHPPTNQPIKCRVLQTNGQGPFITGQLADSSNGVRDHMSQKRREEGVPHRVPRIVMMMIIHAT